MKLLCIEDNTELIESLRYFFEADSKIDNATTGKDGLAKAQRKQYDAIILDLGLPDMSGLEVCTQLRKKEVAAPILVLSGSRDSGTKVALFEAGADDYLTKPFTMAELKARLFALLRRTNFDNNNQRQDFYLLRVGNLTLDPLSGRVERSGKLIKLRRKEFGILEYLMRNKGKIVTRAMIMDNVWEPDCSSWDGTVNVHIKRLRDQIDRPYGHKLIKTAYGLGYTISDKSQ
ncbi:MAG TPA: response regulator transcription factor [Candidatus Saccharimonadales bacterium]|nr:response regulator transcription factor [Candidatus Saccharimonadales bacterium]